MLDHNIATNKIDGSKIICHPFGVVSSLVFLGIIIAALRALFLLHLSLIVFRNLCQKIFFPHLQSSVIDYHGDFYLQIFLARIFIAI
jgi:hypothetical protein